MLRAKHRRLRAAAGFTLIELLLALLMFATIAGVIFASFGAVADGVDKGRQSTDIFRVGRGVLQRMMQEIGAAVQYDEWPQEMRFVGEDGQSGDYPRDRLTFVTMPYRYFGAATPEGELCDVAYFIEENTAGRAALFRTEDCTLDDDRLEEVPRLELTDLVVGLDITYFDPEGDHEHWPPNARNDAPLPCRVRVALTLRDAQEYERVFITTMALMRRDTCGEEEARGGTR